MAQLDHGMPIQAKPPGRALIVGASRGLGLALVREYLSRGWHVVATTRGSDVEVSDTDRARLKLIELDVTDVSAIAALPSLLAETEDESLDLLFVVAGVLGPADLPAGRVSAEQFSQVMHTNALAPVQVMEALANGVRANGVIAAMTSVLGSVSRNEDGGYETYRASKAALNSLLRSFAARHRSRTIIAMHPGWVRTEMGGKAAPLSAEASARGIAEVIAAKAGQPGCAFLDYKGEDIPW